MWLIKLAVRVILTVNMQLAFRTVTRRDLCEEVSFEAPLLVGRLDHTDAGILYFLSIAVVCSNAEGEPETFTHNMIGIEVCVTLTHHNICLIIRDQFLGLHHAIETKGRQEDDCHAKALA